MTDAELSALKAEVEKLRGAAAYQAEAHTLRTGIKLHTERLRAIGYTNRKQESNLQMIGRALDEIATLRAEIADAREALKDARLQLEYLDSRWPTGTTPTILTRISVALGNQK